MGDSKCIARLVATSPLSLMLVPGGLPFFMLKSAITPSITKKQLISHLGNIVTGATQWGLGSLRSLTHRPMPGWISFHPQGCTVPTAWWTGHQGGIQRKPFPEEFMTLATCTIIKH